MKKFLVLYRSTISVKEQMAKARPEEGKAAMAAWEVWMKKAGSALLDVGAPLADSAVLKGKAGEGHINGYTIVQAASLDAARKLFEAHPHFETPGASIEILEQVSMPGM